MCGVPVHAYQAYVNKLTKAGLKVAICEQMEDPALAKGLVKREVVRVITPGTILAEDLLEPGKNQFLLSLTLDSHKKLLGLAFADLTTGELELEEIEVQGGYGAFLERFQLYRPKEILFPKAHRGEDFYGPLVERLLQKPPHLEPFDRYHFEPEPAVKVLTQHFGVLSLDGFGLGGLSAGLCAAGALLAYLKETQKESLAHFQSIRRLNPQKTMLLDEATVANLELFESQDGSVQNSLLGLLDLNKTPMGSRLLRRWIGSPLLELGAITRRLDRVSAFVSQVPLTQELRLSLKEIGDLERTLARISLSGCTVQDLIRLKRGLAPLEGIKALLGKAQGSGLEKYTQPFDSLADLFHLLDCQLVESASGVKLTEGGYIAPGVDEQLDRLRGLARDGKQLIANLEAKERRETGIGSLKISYNRVFGYYLEVTKATKGQVPDRYLRKQTLAGSERYSTPELAELEESLLGADDEAKALEMRIFGELRAKVIAQAGRIQAMSRLLAQLDVLSSLAQVARERNYVRPEFNLDPNERVMFLSQARHPVIEAILTDQPFIANDLELNGQTDWIHILTGPNMGGKSTYMRQAALIALMAQMGSFVPAKQARLPLFDRIFTRVGASDSLTRGQSTFMVEMTEAASILNNASRTSLVILDEIGRGTSTLDGISLAWAIVEHLHRLGALTLFATHYHELVRLEEELKGVSNAKVVVKEEGEKIVFLKKVVAGQADKSYGIHVAELAGLPRSVLSLAKGILNRLEYAQARLADSLDRNPSLELESKAEPVNQQISFAPVEAPWVEELRSFDLNHKTPLEALQLVHRLQQKL